MALEIFVYASLYSGEGNLNNSIMVILLIESIKNTMNIQACQVPKLQMIHTQTWFHSANSPAPIHRNCPLRRCSAETLLLLGVNVERLRPLKDGRLLVPKDLQTVDGVVAKELVHLPGVLAFGVVAFLCTVKRTKLRISETVHFLKKEEENKMSQTQIKREGRQRKKKKKKEEKRKTYRSSSTPDSASSSKARQSA